MCIQQVGEADIFQLGTTFGISRTNRLIIVVVQVKEISSLVI